MSVEVSCPFFLWALFFLLIDNSLQALAMRLLSVLCCKFLLPRIVCLLTLQYLLMNRGATLLFTYLFLYSHVLFGKPFKHFLPWSCEHSPKLASQTFPCISVSWRAHVSPAVWLHSCFLAPVVLTLLLWGLRSKNHGSRSFVVLAFAFISIIHQKLWSSGFHFSHMEIQVPFADQIVLSPLFCKPSVQKYMHLFLALQSLLVS